MMEVSWLLHLSLPVVVICGLIQLGVWAFGSRRPEPLYWALADFIGLAGAVLLSLRTTTPDWLTLAIGNSLLVASMTASWIGLRRVVGHHFAFREIALITLACAGIVHLQWWLWDDLGARVLTASLVLGFCNAGIAWDLAQGDSRARHVRTAMAGLFAIHALFFLFRAGTAMTLDAEGDFMRTGGLQATTVLIAVVKVMLWNAGALVLLRGGRATDALP